MPRANISLDSPRGGVMLILEAKVWGGAIMNIRLLLTLAGCLLFTAWVGVRVSHSDLRPPLTQEGRWAYESPKIGWNVESVCIAIGPMAVGQVRVYCLHTDVKGVCGRSISPVFPARVPPLYSGNPQRFWLTCRRQRLRTDAPVILRRKALSINKSLDFVGRAPRLSAEKAGWKPIPRRPNVPRAPYSLEINS